MTNFILAAVVAIAAIYFWLLLVTPLIERLFGVHEPLSFKIPKRRTVKLSNMQRVLLDGVLNFGVGVWIGSATWDFVSCRLYRGYWELPSARYLGIQLSIYLIVGALFGWSGGFGVRQDSTS